MAANTPTPEARALVEKIEDIACYGFDSRDVVKIALAIDAHREAAVLAEREAIAEDVLLLACTNGCRQQGINPATMSVEPVPHAVCEARRNIARNIRARTPPAGRGTR